MFAIFVKFFTNFNSHAHVERDRFPDYLKTIQQISTHTLTWSVTFGIISSSYRLIYFNSHAHVERDSNCISQKVSIHISTHTLTWSVTDDFIVKSYQYSISTHTLTWSVTDCFDLKCSLMLFQLTRSRGA